MARRKDEIDRMIDEWHKALGVESERIEPGCVSPAQAWQDAAMADPERAAAAFLARARRYQRLDRLRLRLMVFSLLLAGSALYLIAFMPAGITGEIIGMAEAVIAAAGLIVAAQPVRR
jgi:hypothetical protein